MLDRFIVKTSKVLIFEANRACICWVWVADEISPDNSSYQVYIQTDPGQCTANTGTPVSRNAGRVPVQMREGDKLYAICGVDQALVGVSVVYE